MQAKVVTHRTREPICRLSCRFADGKNTPLPSPIPFMAEFRYRGSALRIQDLKYTTFLSPGGLAAPDFSFLFIPFSNLALFSAGSTGPLTSTVTCLR